MSVNPTITFINDMTAQYITKAEVISALQGLSSLSTVGSLFTNPIVSSITVNPTGTIRGGALLSTLSLQVSSINGAQIDTYTDIQRSDTNNFGASNITVQPWPTFSPTVSTTTNFNWNSNGLYQCYFPFNATINTAPADSNAAIVFYLGTANASTPSPGASVATTAGQTNVRIETGANACIDPPTTGGSPLVLWVASRGTASNATITVNTSITGGQVPIVANRIA